jgi:hypothetical protein
LFDWQVLAYVTVRSGAQGGVHPLLIISDTGKNNDGQILAHLPNKSDQGNAVYLGHIEIDHDHVALMVFEPGCRLKTLGKVITGVSLLLEVGDKEFRDRGVIIDKQKFNWSAREHFHERLIL